MSEITRFNRNCLLPKTKEAIDGVPRTKLIGKRNTLLEPQLLEAKCLRRRMVSFHAPPLAVRKKMNERRTSQPDGRDNCKKSIWEDNFSPGKEALLPYQKIPLDRGDQRWTGS